MAGTMFSKPNFGKTGGNTAKKGGPKGASSMSRNSQAGKTFDHQRLAHTNKEAGRTAPSGGGRGTFMNK